MLGFYSRLTVAEPSRSTESKWWSTCGRDRLEKKCSKGNLKTIQGKGALPAISFLLCDYKNWQSSPKFVRLCVDCQMGDLRLFYS